MKKLLVMLLAVIMAMTSLVGLSVVAEQELYEIEILTNNSKWEISTDSKIGQYIADKFGIVFKNIYYAGDMREKQSTSLAAGDYGEIVWLQRNDMVSAYYNAGALYCIEDHLAEMPNFSERYVEQLDRWRAPTDGKLYKWETNTPNANYETCEVAIRSDILELNGWKMPTTVSELTALLIKAKETYPTTVDGLMTVGMTVPFAEGWGLQGVACIGYEKGGKYLSIGNEGVVFNWPEDKFEDYFLIPETKESLKMFNTWYQEGVLDVECFTDYGDQTNAKTATGQAFAVWYATWCTNNQAMIEAGLSDYQYVNCFIQLDSQAANGEPRSFKVETARPFDSYAITTAARYPERLIELIEWTASDEGQTIFMSGFEGEGYDLFPADLVDQIEWVPSEEDPTKFVRVCNFDEEAVTIPEGEVGVRVPTEWLINSTEEERYEYGFSTFGFLPMDASKNSPDGQRFSLRNETKYSDLASLTERQREVYAKMGFSSSKQWGDEHGAFVDTGTSGSITLDATSEEAKIMQQMVDCRLKWSAKLILAETDEEFEAIWADAVAEYDLLDHQKVVDTYNELYAASK